MQSMMIPRKSYEEIGNLVKKFIWRSSNKKKNMSLVGLDSICQPKWCGSLGMRKLQDQNISFSLKLGFNITYDKEALWVRVIRSKYQMNENLPCCIARDRSYFLWRTL